MHLRMPGMLLVHLQVFVVPFFLWGQLVPFYAGTMSYFSRIYNCRRWTILELNNVKVSRTPQGSQVDFTDKVLANTCPNQ